MIKLFKEWKLYEIIWLGSFSATAVVMAILSGSSLFVLTIFLAGVLCVFLAAKGNIWTYPLGVYNTACYGFLTLQNGLYGEMGVNFLFFVPINIIGYFLWRKHMAGPMVKMCSMGWKMLLQMCIACPTGILATGFLFSLIEGQHTPYVNATTTILSIMATILMVTRYKEQWILYIILNIFTIIMWSLRFRDGSPDAPVMIVMWGAYLVNSVYGYYIWNKGSVRKTR